MMKEYDESRVSDYKVWRWNLLQCDRQITDTAQADQLLDGEMVTVDVHYLDNVHFAES